MAPVCRLTDSKPAVMCDNRRFFTFNSGNNSECVCFIACCACWGHDIRSWDVGHGDPLNAFPSTTLVRFGSEAEIRRSLGPSPLYPRKRTLAGRPRHVRFVPTGDTATSVISRMGLVYSYPSPSDCMPRRDWNENSPPRFSPSRNVRCRVAGGVAHRFRASLSVAADASDRASQRGN